jgi:hypothetical protein
LIQGRGESRGSKGGGSKAQRGKYKARGSAGLKGSGSRGSADKRLKGVQNKKGLKGECKKETRAQGGVPKKKKKKAQGGVQYRKIGLKGECSLGRGLPGDFGTKIVPTPKIKSRILAHFQVLLVRP